MYREQKVVPGFALSPIDTEIIINYRGYDFLPTIYDDREKNPPRALQDGNSDEPDATD
jgi:hypothetical protein